MGIKPTYDELAKENESLRKELLNKKTEGKAHKLLDSIEDSILLCLPDGVVCYCNEAFCKTMNLKREEIIGQNYLNLFEPDVEKFMQEQLNTISKTEQAIELLDETHNSIYQTTLKPIFDKYGKLSHVSITKSVKEKIIAEKALKESEEKLRNIIENSTNMFYSHSVNHVLNYVSPQSESILGYLPEEAMINWTNFITDNPINKKGYEYTQRAIDTGVTQPTFELELYHKNGEKVWVEVHEAPVVKNGKTILIVGALTNISERKKAEQKLKESEKMFSTIFELSPNGLAITNVKSGKIYEVNQSAINILGYTKDELLASSPLDISIWKSKKGRNKTLKKLLEKRSLINEEVQYLTKSGKTVDAKLSAAIIEINGKEVILSDIIDATESKKAEKALENSLERLRFAQKAGKIGIWEWDVKADTIIWSDMAYEIFGLHKEKKLLSTDKYFDYVIPEDKQRIIDELDIALTNNLTEHQTEYRIKKGNQTVWIEEVSEIIYDSNKEFAKMIGIMHDITDRKKAEQKLKESNLTKDKFFSILAHDLINPFNTMLGFSNLLVSNFKKYEPSKQEKFIKIIHHNLKNTYKLLENLLLWARSQRGVVDFKPETLNLYLLLGETTGLLEQASKNKNINIENKIPVDINVYADKNMLSTILRNLISNAIKFTHKNGTIEIGYQAGKKHTQEIYVKDTGLGVPKENLNSIFEISENISTKGTEGEIGTGLGLILCKEFVEKHGGTIWVETEIGKGSKFIFTIPYAMSFS